MCLKEYRKEVNMRNEVAKTTNPNRKMAAGRNYYVDGNTIRRAEATPDYTESERLRKERQERIEREIWSSCDRRNSHETSCERQGHVSYIRVE